MLKPFNGCTTFHLSKNTTTEFINSNQLIQSHVKMLHNVRFNSLYGFLKAVKNIACETDYALCSENVKLHLCDMFLFKYIIFEEFINNSRY